MTVERKNRVKDTTNTVGIDSFAMNLSAIVGFNKFSTHTDGATVHYTAVNSSGSQWEVGEGVWTSPTLTRLTIYASSNAGQKVAFSEGQKTVFTGPVAEDFQASSGGVTWVVKTANYTASAGDFIACDTTSAAFTVTLPPTPTVTDAVTIKAGPSASTNALTIDRNGSTLMGLSENMTITTNNAMII